MPPKKVYSKRLDKRTGGKQKYVYQIDVWVGAKRHRPCFDSYSKADQVERRLRAAKLDKKYGIKETPRITLGQLINARLEKLRLRNQPEIRHYELVYRLLKELLGEDRLVAEITKQDLARYVDMRLAAGVKGQSINRELTRISSMFNKAGEMFALLEDWQPPKMPREKEPKHGRQRVLSEDEINRLIAELERPPKRPNVFHQRRRQDALDYLLIAVQTMLRGGELRHLKWSYVNFRWRTITLPTAITKTDEPRIVEMTSQVMEILQRRQKEAKAEGLESEYIFPNRREGKRGKNAPSVDLRTVIRNACERAGIPFGRDTAGGWMLHDLRHTATTIALEQGAPIAGVQQMAGHSDRTMTLRYAHATPASRAQTVRALESFTRRIHCPILSDDARENVAGPPTPQAKKAGKS